MTNPFHFQYCDHCQKKFAFPEKKVSLTLVESDEHSSQRIGELHYHEECFYAIAGQEYYKKFRGIPELGQYVLGVDFAKPSSPGSSPEVLPSDVTETVVVKNQKS
jgi:hypothetical protein